MTDGFDASFTLSGKRVWVAGHNGLVGSALMRRLAQENCQILSVSKDDLDLRDQAGVKAWMNENKPEVVILAAARVGGILDNATHPAAFLYDNLIIEVNVIHGAYEAGVEKLLFLGSSCIYPKDAKNPIKEEVLLTGPLEPSNESYAVAKIAGLKMCQAYRQQYGCDFISAMPCNLYGPGDRFDLSASHVIPALMMKAHEAKVSRAKQVDVWGSGKPRREFLYVDDLADALVFLLKNYSGNSPVNVGAREDVTIAELANMVAETVGFEGDLAFDLSKPDGVSQKRIDASRIQRQGWLPKTDLKSGLAQTYAWYVEHKKYLRGAQESL